MFSSNCCFLNCIQISKEAGQVVWSSDLLKNFPLFIVIHTVTGFGIVDQIRSDQSLSCVRLYATPWIAARQASLSITNSRSLLKHISIESVIPSSYLTFCRPLLLLPSIFPSIRVFSSESALCIRWPKYWSFSFMMPIQWIFRIDFSLGLTHLLTVQGTLKRLLQHQSLKASILQCSAFLWSSSHIHTWLLEKP